MAISGSFYGTTENGAIKPRITWSAEADTEGNYSQVTATLSYSRTDSYKTYGHWEGTLTINGNTASGSGTYMEITKNSNTVALTHSVKVPHKDDGTKTVTISATGTIPGTTLTKTSVSAQVTLEQIPRAATVGAADGDIGSVSTVTIGKKSNAYTYTVAWKFGSLSGYLTPDGVSETAEHVTASSLAFPLPEEFYYEIPNSPTGDCTLTCTTYLKGTAIGTPQTAAFTVRADPARCGPQLTVSAKDVEEATLELTGDAKRFVRYVSTARCSMTPKARYGASVSKRRIAGKTLSANSLDITQIDTDTVRFSVTDSRGYTVEKKLTLELVNYSKPVLRLAAARTDATSGKAKLEISGSFFGGSFGSAANRLKLKYRIDGGSAVALEPEISGNGYALSHALQNLDYTRSYSVSVTATDSLYSKTVKAVINPGVPVFEWGKSDFTFHTPVSLSGNRLTELAEPEQDTDGVNLGYARETFAPAGEYVNRCITVSKADTDLNDYQQEGTWYFGTDYTPANIPIGSNGWLHVLRRKSTSRVMAKQFWYRQGSLGSTDHQTFVRTYDSTAGWGGWTRYTTEKEAYTVKKLWENASPGSTFAAQTLSLNLSDYDAVTVFYRNASDSTVYLSTGVLPIGYRTSLSYVTTGGTVYGRPVTVEKAGLTFESGTSGSSSSTKTGIPVTIYGIKGVT